MDFKKSAGVLAAAALSSDITRTSQIKSRATEDPARSLCSVCHLLSSELADQKARVALLAAGIMGNMKWARSQLYDESEVSGAASKMQTLRKRNQKCA